MAGQLLLVNPKRRGGKRRKGRSAAQRRATAKLVAFNKRRGGGKSSPRKKARRRRNPFVNPVNKPRRRSRSHSRRRSNPTYRRRRRNPSMRGMGGNIMGTVMDSAIGAGGAMAVDVAWNFLPVPVTLKAGPVGTLAKAGGTIALGMLAAKMIGGAMARKATVGALTVQIHNYIRPLLASVIPGLGYYGAGYALDGLGRYISDTPSSLGAFVPNSLSDMDYDTANYPGIGLEEYIR